MTAGILLTGADGQLGWEVRRRAAAAKLTVHAANRAALDITNRDAVQRAVDTVMPKVVVNAAAYTAVDKAESDQVAAFAVNRDGAAHLAEACARHGLPLIHISTDYVFDGSKPNAYVEDDPVAPLGVYGASKLAGEDAVRRHGPRHIILRTAWVYGVHGHNFVKTMLRLLRERKEVRVVCDQIGTPTHAHGLAHALWRFSTREDLRGIFHWTDAGVASWYDFAAAIAEAVSKRSPELTGSVIPINSADFEGRARRPQFSVLDKTLAWSCLGPSPHWRAELFSMLGQCV